MNTSKPKTGIEDSDSRKTEGVVAVGCDDLLDALWKRAKQNSWSYRKYNLGGFVLSYKHDSTAGTELTSDACLLPPAAKEDFAAHLVNVLNASNDQALPQPTNRKEIIK